MNTRVKHTIVSTLMSFLFLLTTGSIHGAVSANRSVSVSCEGNNIGATPNPFSPFPLNWKKRLFFFSG